MALSMDPDVLAALQPIMAARAGLPVPALGDVDTRRAGAAANLPKVFAGLPAEGVTSTDLATTGSDGAEVPLRWYEPAARTGRGAALYLHGGGMILGSVEIYDRVIASVVAASGVPMLAVDYRLAPEHPHPTPVEDCYAGLVALARIAADRDVDPARLAVMGDSAGGGLAAAVVRLSKQRGGPSLARQLLIYPMLDDRTITPDPSLTGLVTWSYQDNQTAWQALLGDAAGSADVPWSAAPARATSPADLELLPPAYIEVGGLDIFRAESVAYAEALYAAGVSTELAVVPGCPHGFDVYAQNAPVTGRVRAERTRVLRSL